MAPRKKLRNRRGFTLAELLIVVAILVLLAGLAFAFIDPHEISYVEYNRSAEAIATAVQNRLTDIRNSGDMSELRELGDRASKTGGTASTALESEKTLGGYRYVFSYTRSADGTAVRNAEIGYLLPFGAIDYEIAQNYFAIGFQSDTGMVGEVFYSPNPFPAETADYLVKIAGEPETRKAEGIGYYKGEVYGEEVAFANLPTPQLTITNFEELTLNIYLPEVKQLETYGKKLGVLVSLADEKGKAYEGEDALGLADTAIYSTFSLGGTKSGDEDPPVVIPQNIDSGQTYTIVLDTVKSCDPFTDMDKELAADYISAATSDVPKGMFEDWAKKSDAFRRPFLLGENSRITVTVYCLYQPGEENYDADFPINPTFMPRSASVTFNGWFNSYERHSDYDEVGIACGRHLQNLGKLTQMRDNLKPYLPEVTEKNGVYSYGDYNYGLARAYTDGSSDTKTTDYPYVHGDDVKEKYIYREGIVQSKILRAYQVNAIDFDCSGWKEADGTRIPFTPVNLPEDFRYYGNYLTITHLYVDAPFYAGLFGYAYRPYFYDILLVNPSVTSQVPAYLAELYEMGVGALIGTSRHSHHINNCQVYMMQENKTYDSAKYRVTGKSYVGGLIGFCEDEEIENCSASVYTGYRKDATETVDGKETHISSKYVGGLVGCITGQSELEECYAAGNLSGVYVGGLLGYIKEDSNSPDDDYRIQSCYSAGHIEYAEQEAAGLVGCMQEFTGNSKSAVSIYANYCAVIYGEKSGSGYVWNCTKTVGGKTVAVPIYGTYKGDGFEWIRNSGAILTAKYGSLTFSAGSTFENDNKNYYIAQQGITYSNSPYYEATKTAVQSILTKINSASSQDALKKAVTEAKEQIIWLKKLQALEELKSAMENVIYEFDNTTGKDNKGNAYNLGGYYSSSGNSSTVFYLDTNDAEITSSTSSNNVELTAVQALHAMFDGTYPYADAEGKTQTKSITITDKNHNKADEGETGAIDDFTFMGFYNALKTAYTDLANGRNIEAAQNTLKFVFGDNTKETYQTTESGVIKEYPFYYEGRFYASFYANMFYRLFDKCKDYYEKGIKDTNGELIYRHFREDFGQSDIRVKICDLGMSPFAREILLARAKPDAMQPAIDALNGLLPTIDMWDDDLTDTEGNAVVHGMSGKITEAKGYINSAVTAFQELQKLFDESTYASASAAPPYVPYSLTELEQKIAAAKNAMNDLYDFFDTYKNNKDVIGTKTVEVKNEKGEKVKETRAVVGDMRNFRSTVSSYLYYYTYAEVVANSGVEGALDYAAAELNDSAWLTGIGGYAVAKQELVDKINTYLGSKWQFTDSGHRLYNAEQLRNVVRGYIYGEEKSADHQESLGFMYDYGNSYKDSDGHQINPYYGHIGSTGDDFYVDWGDRHQVYNNVFPYIEGTYTKYYPFPFVFGREIENGGYQPATYELFHYGDWLTEDLWAKTTVSYHTDYPELDGFSGGSISLAPSSFSDKAGFEAAFAQSNADIRADDDNIDVPFYFEGWYTDEACTEKYTEAFAEKVGAAAERGETVNFDLYAKWTQKPSLIFQAADLEAEVSTILGKRTITVDTLIKLTIEGETYEKISRSENGYEQITVWLNQDQKVELYVAGHYSYSGYSAQGAVLENPNDKDQKVYMVYSLEVKEPELTDAVWLHEAKIDKDAGTVNFTVPTDATSDDKYVLAVSLNGNIGTESGGEEPGTSGGNPGFDFGNFCLVEGTRITMADGSSKAVEELAVGDTVLAFNHLSGKYEPTAVWMTPHSELVNKPYTVTTLCFSDGSSLNIVGEHGLFDRSLSKYVFLNEENYSEYLGHEFSAVTASAGGFEDRTVTLLRASVSEQITKIYSPITENYLNIVAEDLLTVTSMLGHGDAVMNLFEFEADMSYNRAAMAADIGRYGLYTYEDFADLLPQEVFAKVPLGVMKVAVGKGLISYEEVKQIIVYIYQNGYLAN